MGFYLVTAKCGHVGRGKYIDVVFPVIADNGSSAAQLILKRSKVKKQLKNAITSVEEISELEYKEFKQKDYFLDYLKAHSKREYDVNNYILKKLETKEKRKIEFESRNERISYIMRKNKVINNDYRDSYILLFSILS